MTPLTGPDLARALFKPKAIALVGISDDVSKTAARPLRFLRAAGYAGTIYNVNPTRSEVQGERAYPSLSALPEKPDHAFILTNTGPAIATVEECGKLGIPLATVLAGGFSEKGAEGAVREQQLKALGKQYGVRPLGPSSIGLVNVREKLILTANAAFAEPGLPVGGIFCASHSGSLIGALTSRGRARNIGFHSLVSVGGEADIEAMAKAAVAAKFRNPGQICVSPTRFFVQQDVYEPFIEAFAEHAGKLQVGNGFDPATTIGPVANRRRLKAMTAVIDDAVNAGAKISTGGQRIGERGFFFEPTVLRDVPAACLAMREEPFGPLALMMPFIDCEEVIQRANTLPLGLAGYVCTTNTKRQALFRENLEVGTLGFNHFVASWAETPFGGVKDSGLGSEGGIEGLQAFQQVKFISEA